MQLLPGVLGGYDLAFLPIGRMKIDLGGGDGAVTQKVLNVFNINPFFQKKGCEGMPKYMRRDIFVDSGKPCVFCHKVSDCLCR